MYAPEEDKKEEIIPQTMMTLHKFDSSMSRIRNGIITASSYTFIRCMTLVVLRLVYWTGTRCSPKWVGRIIATL
jgi:hypothetical protein